MSKEEALAEIKELGEIKQALAFKHEQEKLEAMNMKLQQFQAVIAQQASMNQTQKASFMMSSDPRQEAEIALHDLARSIDILYEWGQNAKDPLGNFLPDALASDVKEKYNRLKWIITGMYSGTSIPRNGSLGSAVGTMLKKR